MKYTVHSPGRPLEWRCRYIAGLRALTCHSTGVGGRDAVGTTNNRDVSLSGDMD